VTKKTEPEVIRMTSSVERQEQNVGRSQLLYELFEPHLVHRLRNIRIV